MKILSNKKKIYFQKTLVAQTKIGEEKNTKPVDIYKFDNEDDIKELKKASNSSAWKNNFYLNKYILDDFPKCYHTYDYYVMEDKKGKILSYTQLRNNFKQNMYIDYLEVSPELSTYNPERKIRYVGETMMAFIASLAQKQDKGIYIPEVAPRNKTLKFYVSTCGMKQVGVSGAMLKKNNLKYVIASHEVHSDSKIELVG